MSRPLTATINVRLDGEILAEIDRVCRRRGQTRSEAIREALETWARKVRAFERLKQGSKK
jgi:metal-responsive CopG/Arc/MetJ family transcriptional regulator